MKISEDARKYAAEQQISEDEALQAGMEKSKEFAEKGAKLYANALAVIAASIKCLLQIIHSLLFTAWLNSRQLKTRAL